MNELPNRLLALLVQGSYDIPGQFSVRDHSGEYCHAPEKSVEGENSKHLREKTCLDVFSRWEFGPGYLI